MKIVFIGAGSGFGARTIVDLMSFPELRNCELVLVDVNQEHLTPVLAYAEKVVKSVGGTAKVTGALDWRNCLDGASYVITAFAQGGPAYAGIPYYYEINTPMEYGIHQNVGDTVGIGGVFRMLRCAPELVEIGKTMERVCPGAWLLNYVNPMSMLTRILNKSCPKIHTLGICHNIQWAIWDICQWLKIKDHKTLRYEAAGVNHMDWFLRLEYIDGRSVYPDLLKAGEDPGIWEMKPTQFELLRQFGYWTTESSEHCAEYLPYFMRGAEGRARLKLKLRELKPERVKVSSRWTNDSDLMKELDGRKPLDSTRSFEYVSHIVHALETDNVYRMHLNVMNNGLIDNFTRETCVEVCCTADRTGVHPHKVGMLPTELAALSGGMANMQTLASDAFLEHDLGKACLACMIDPCTAASATPAAIRECFNKLLDLEREWLQPYWGSILNV